MVVDDVQLERQGMRKLLWKITVPVDRDYPATCGANSFRGKKCVKVGLQPISSQPATRKSSRVSRCSADFRQSTMSPRMAFILLSCGVPSPRVQPKTPTTSIFSLHLTKRLRFIQVCTCVSRDISRGYRRSGPTHPTTRDIELQEAHARINHGVIITDVMTGIQ